MKEEWKDVIGFEGIYQVSDLGRVKSLQRMVVRPKGSYIKKEIILKPTLLKIGYLFIKIRDGFKYHPFYIHRLIATHFMDNEDNQRTVNHKNGIKTDNRIENLEWATHSENIKHAYDTGLKVKIGMMGEKNNQSKLKAIEVFKIKYMHKDLNNKEVSKIYNVTKENISSIRTGKSWKHI